MSTYAPPTRRPAPAKLKTAQEPPEATVRARRAEPIATRSRGESIEVRAVPVVQAKLRVGPVDDPLEREADRIAEHVVSGAGPDHFTATTGPERASSLLLREGAVQRACSACAERDEHEEDIRREAAPGATVRRKCDRCATGAVEPGVTPEVQAGIEQLRQSGGQRLDAETRAFMEPRFGHSFSSVRVHDGAVPARLAASLQARAFTIGRDVFFGRGEFRSDTMSGKQLLAHELTHTIQQGSGSRHLISRAPIGKGLDCTQVLARDETIFPPEVKPQPEEWFSSGTILDDIREAEAFKTATTTSAAVGGGRSNATLLAQGSSDRDAVTLLQRFLMWFHCDRRLGRPLRGLGALGAFGGITIRMVRTFQSHFPASGLQVDGVVGPFTLDAMDRVLMGLQPVALNTTGAPTVADEPGSLQWSISGTVATATADGASLFALARQVGGTIESIGCIEPLVMLREKSNRPPDFSTHYMNHVSAGDSFDFGMLTRAAAPVTDNVLRLHFFHNQPLDEALARRFWPGIAPASPDVDLELEDAVLRGGGAPQPITELVLYGHASGTQMFANGGPTFEVGHLSRNRLPGGDEQTFDDARDRRFTRNCMFARTEGTVIDTIGCRSERFGRAFALAYLRQRASVRTTLNFLIPLCVDPALSRTSTCSGFDSVGQNSVLAPSDAQLVAAIALSNDQWQSGNPQFLADPVVGPYFSLQDLIDNATNPIPSAL